MATGLAGKMREGDNRESVIWEAVLGGNITLYRQRIVTPRLHIIRFEVLSRINFGDELMLPADWLPVVLADRELAILLDYQILERTIARCANLPGRQAWVNVFGSTITRELPGFIAALLKKYDCPANRVCIEVTETVAVDHVLTLANLINLGLDVAMDDCGSGNSTFRAAVDLPLTWVKIDGELMLTQRRMKVAKYICLLAKELRLGVVAEWVESPSQAQFMLGYGCDGFQGFNIPSFGKGYPILWMPGDPIKSREDIEEILD